MDGWNAIKINQTKCEVVCFTRARVKEPLNYTLGGTIIPEASSCKYLGIILCSDLNWSDQVNHKVKKAWKAIHFKMLILKKETVTPKFSIHIFSASDTGIWSGVLGSLQRGSDKCVRPGAKESGQICTPQERIELENLDSVQEVSSLMCSLQSAHGWTGLEGRRGQIINTMLPEQGWSWQEN
jgi:hypothetical protein